MSVVQAPERVSVLFQAAKRLQTQERLVLAKLLLESVLDVDVESEADWSAMGLAAFEKDWDNSEDAIYDNWREHYGVPAG
jgi:hypothetical protein